MRLDNERESDNVEDMRGASYGGGGGFGFGGRSIGIGGIIIALIAAYFFGIDPSVILGGGGGGVPAQVQTPQGPAPRPPSDDPVAHRVSQILAKTEDTWSQIFTQAGRTYERPKLTLFSGSFPTACGMGQAAMGPFYCPLDHKVYIDLRFFNLMRDRFHASGEFAQAYVIAHEVGHHVQTLLGISDKLEASSVCT